MARRVLLHGRSATFAAFRPTCVLPLNVIQSVCSSAWYPVGMAAGLLLAGCSGNAGSESAAEVPPPTGHYEGPISYQGTELRVALELREIRPGQLQAEISFPQLPGLEFEASRTTYRAPQLRLEQESGRPGAVTVQAVREGDFLRGVLSWDTIQADFVWARRGEAAPRGLREQVLPGPGSLRLLLPDDTLPQHPALVLLARPATRTAAAQRALYLARQGVATVVLPLPAATPDSVAGRTAAALLATLRHQPAVDTLKLGYWSRGADGLVVAAAAAQVPAPAFVVLEGAPAATRAAAQPYQVLARQRIPVLALYAGLDTAARPPASARQLRLALGNRRGTQVRILPQVTPDFLRPGTTGPDGQWQWPQPAAAYWPGLLEWLRQR